MRFIEYDGRYVNANAIRDIEYRGNSNMYISFIHGDGFTTKFDDIDRFLNELNGTRHVVQVIPAHVPLWMVWGADDDDTHYARPAYFLALCADGYVRPLHFCEGSINIPSGVEYAGVYREDQLSEFFTNVEKSGETKTEVAEVKYAHGST